MKKEKLSIWCCLYSYVVFRSSMAEICSSPNQLSDTKFGGNVIQTISPTGFKFCIQDCISIQSCLSLNYHKFHFKCELFDSDISTEPTAISPQPGSIYVSISDVLSNANRTCGGKICEEWARCIELSSGNYECIDIDCRNDLPSLSNGYVAGKTRVPLTATYRCNSGYAGFGSQNILTCRPGDVWSSLSYSCRQIVHGNWGQWSSWEECSESCDGGTRTRIRSCNNPSPQNGGNSCNGESSETEDCNTESCESGSESGGWFWSKR